MLGIIIGIITGVIQCFLMVKVRGSSGNKKSKGRIWLYIFAQFLLPFAVLVAVGFLLPDDLIATVIAMAAALFVSTILRYVLFANNDK